MNQVQIFGRLTRDPELRFTPQGKAVIDFSLAVNRYGNNEADFFDCVAWEKQAENIGISCKKGHRLLIWGRLQQDRWTDNSGQNRTAVKIQVSGFSFIEPPPQSQQQTQPPAGPPQYQGPPGYQPPANPPQYQGPPNYQPPAGPPQYQGPPGQQSQASGGYQQPAHPGYPPPQYNQPPMAPPGGHLPGPMGAPYQGQPHSGGYFGPLDDVPF